VLAAPWEAPGQATRARPREPGCGLRSFESQRTRRSTEVTEVVSRDLRALRSWKRRDRVGESKTEGGKAPPDKAGSLRLGFATVCEEGKLRPADRAEEACRWVSQQPPVLEPVQRLRLRGPGRGLRSFNPRGHGTPRDSARQQPNPSVPYVHSPKADCPWFASEPSSGGAQPDDENADSSPGSRSGALGGLGVLGG